MYYDKNASDLISDIFKVLILLIIIGIGFIIFKNGFNHVFIKTKTKVNKAKNIINDRLTEDNLKYSLNENLFEFLSKIKTFIDQPNFFVLVISVFLFILWFYVLYTITQSYFYDSEVLYKDNDEYNIKHLFDSIYSNYDKQVWVNSDTNNYISESGKLCKLNFNIFNSCLGKMNNYTNDNIFNNNNISPDFVKATKEMLLKKYYGNGNIFIRQCSLNIIDTGSGFTDCSYIPVTIETIMYNTRKIKINKVLLNDTETNNSDLIDFDDSRIIYPLEPGYYFDIKYSDLHELFKQTTLNKFSRLEEKGKFNPTENDFIKCKIKDITTNDTTGNIDKFELKVYNPNNNMKGTQYESFDISGISGEVYMGNKNTCQDSDKSSSIIKKFNTVSYLGKNMKLIFDQEKEKKENQENDIDLSNILEDDLVSKLQLEKDNECIIYNDYDDLIKGDIVKIMDNNEIISNPSAEQKENFKSKSYNVLKYDVMSGKYSEPPITIGRNYLLCSDSKKNTVIANDLFSNNCKQQQENKVMGHTPNNDFYNYGCK